MRKILYGSIPPNYYVSGFIHPLPVPTGTTNAPNSPDTPFDYYDGFSAKGSSNAMADVHNDLSFFVIDGLIYDKEGMFVDLAFQDNQNQWDSAPTTSTLCSYSCSYDGFMIGQETMIVPTSDCNRFVIVSSFSRQVIPFYTPPTPQVPNPEQVVQLRALPVYCIYDAQTKTVIQRGPWYGGSNGSGINDYTSTQMNPNNSIPIFTEQSTSNSANTNGDSPYTVNDWGLNYLGSGLSGFATSDINPDGSRFLVTITGNVIVVVKLEANGNLRYWKRFLVNYGVNLKRSSELELVFNSTTNRFQLAYSAGNFSEFITYCEFSSDFLTMTSSQQVTLPYSDFTGFYGISGLEFSPNNNYLYFTCDVFHNQTPNFPDTKLGYLDIGNINYTVFNPPISFVPNTSSSIFNASFLELNSSGNFLLSGANGLYQISNPNNPNLLTINYSPTVPISIESTIGCLQTEYFNTKYYPLPDQIDGMDYSARFTQNLECCLNSRDYGMTTYNASGTDVWNSASDINGLSLTGNTVIVKDELRIKAGSVITINNMTFKFAPGARVVIEKGYGITPGGKLIMDNGSVFTQDDQCTGNIYWLGVEVQGNGNLPQTNVMNTTQGILMMKNNSVIEYAQIGALVAQRVIQIPQPTPNNMTMLSAQYVASSGGGIIQASNAIFRNNFIDVDFQPYHYLTNGGNWPSNFSTFSNCTFITTSSFTNYPIVGSGPTHVRLTDVKGLGFVSCDFSNSTPFSNIVTARGIGILSRNAIYSLNSFCGLNCTNNNGTFTGLYFGIRAFSTGFPTLSVDQQDFYNNTFGIDLEGPDFAKVTNNHFEVSCQPAVLLGKTYGLYLNACTGYHVENNHFTSSCALNNANTYGVVVNNSGTSHNEIYGNYFSFLKVGTQAQGVNAYTPTPPILIPIFAPTYGLQFKCNHYLKSIYEADIAVTSGKIDPNQGLISFNFPNPSITNAGNYFSHSDPLNPLVYDFYAAPSVPAIKYVHTNDTQSTPTNHTSQINPVNSGQTRNSNTCPSKINGGIIIPISSTLSLNHFLLLKTDSLRNVIQTKESNFDGGNTENLLTAIATQSSGNLKNTLMSASPYLTDTVLSGYLGTNPPNGLLKQVVIANSPVSSKIAQVIDDMNLPHGIQKQIDNAQTGTSAMTYLTNEISYLDATRSDLINERIHEFIFDTISPSPFDSIAVILKTEGISINNKKRLFDTYCAMPDSGRAAGTRDTIVQMGDASNFSQLADIHLEMLSCTCPGGLNAHPDLIDGLQAIASDANDRISAVKAQCMLSLVSDSLFLPIVEDITPSGNQGMGLSNSGSMESNEEVSALSIYPNPTNNGTVVTLALDSKDETLTNATIEVYSITGQLMLKQAFEGEAKTLSLQPGALHPGVYFVKLISEGTIIETKKLLVER